VIVGSDTKVDQVIILKSIQVEHRYSYMKYLLMADESEEVVSNYIHEGDMFAIYVNHHVAGVALLTFLSEDVVELKNIAIDETYRGKGMGKSVIQEICSIYEQRGLGRIVVGTANSSITNIAFYQKAGFRLFDIKKDFFLQYPEPIFEDGIRAVDMLMFERGLNARKD